MRKEIWQKRLNISRRCFREGVVDELAATLVRRYPGMRGYTRRNLLTVGVQVPGEAARSGAYEVLSERDGELELAITGHDGHIDHTELTLESGELLRWHLAPRLPPYDRPR